MDEEKREQLKYSKAKIFVKIVEKEGRENSFKFNVNDDKVTMELFKMLWYNSMVDGRRIIFTRMLTINFLYTQILSWQIIKNRFRTFGI